MIPDLIKQRLKSSWGDLADALECRAEVKYVDPQSRWACYIFSMNPDNEDEIACIIDGLELEVCDWTMTELVLTYNHQGEHPKIDTEYRSMKASELLKQLQARR